MNTAFNPDLLRIARQARKLTQSALAADSGVSQVNISRWENALLEPAASNLEKVAACLKFPLSFFYEQDRVYGLPMSVHPMMFRKKSAVNKLSVESIEADINIRLMHFRRLFGSIDFATELKFPHLEVDDYAGGAEEIAGIVRGAWLVPSGPIRNLIEYIERAGCLVVPCDFDHSGIDGLSIKTPGLPPCIFYNQNQPADRQRFTIAHELGHLVMHQSPSPTMEDEANAFAAALLMPEREIKMAFLKNVTLERLAELKPQWRVSMAALLYRTKTIGLITDNQSSYLWRQFSTHGYRRQEPAYLDFPPESPNIISEIFRTHIEDLGYSVEEISQFLHSNKTDIYSLYPVPKTIATTKEHSFRVVR